jgi:hypothetical protein
VVKERHGAVIILCLEVLLGRAGLSNLNALRAPTGLSGWDETVANCQAIGSLSRMV